MYILLIDDNPKDRAQTLRELSRELPGLQVEQITEASAFDQALKTSNFDLVITEYQLHWTNGLAVLYAVKAHRPSCPVIMFTATGSEEIAVEAMKAGLDDYVLKSPQNLGRLTTAVCSTLKKGLHSQPTPLERAHEAHYQSFFNNVPVGLYRTTPSGQIVSANPTLAQMLGYPNPQALMAVNAADLNADPQERWRWRAMMERKGVARDFEGQLRRRDGTIIWVRGSARTIWDSKGQVMYYEGILQDITEHKRMEEVLRRRDGIFEAVGFAAEQFLKTSSWEKNIEGVLERLGKATRVSRVYIFQSHKEPGKAPLVSRLYEWTVPGIVAQIDNPAIQDLSLQSRGFARWERVLSRDRVIHGRVKAFPESEQQMLASQNIQSIVIVPVFIGQEWWGGIGLDDCLTEHNWSGAEIDALKTAAGILGAAIQRERTEREIHSRLRETALLNRVIAAATSTLDGKTVLEITCQELAHSFEMPQCSIALLDKDCSEQTIVAVHPISDRSDMLGTVIPVADTPGTEYVIEHKAPLAVADTRAELSLAHGGLRTAIRQALVERGISSLLVIPILLRGEVVGIISLEATKCRQFSNEEITLAQSVAAAVGQAWENVRLYEAAYGRARYLETLNEIGQAVTSTLDLGRVLVTLLEHVRQVTNAEACSVALVDDETGELVFRHAVGGGGQEIIGMRLKPGQGIAGWTALHRQSVLILDAATDPRFYGDVDQETGFVTHDLVCVPIVTHDTVIGVLQLLNKRDGAFDEADTRLLESVAVHAAIAIQNAWLFEETRRRLAELVIVSEVALAGASGKPFDEAVAHATDALSQLWPEANLGFLFVDQVDQVLRMHPSYHGLPSGEPISIPLDQGLTGLAVREQRPVKVGEIASGPHYLKFVADTQSEMAVPLVVGGRAIGVVNVESPSPNAFSEDDLRLLTTLAGQLATLFEKARLDAALAEYTATLERRVQERTAEIRNQQARTQAILDAAGEGVLVTDVNGAILYVNPALEKLTGYTAEEVTSQNPRVWKSGQIPGEVYEEMWATVLAGQTWRGELINKRKDGTLYDAAVAIAPISLSGEDQPVGFVGVQHDITRLKELDRLKSEFVSNVSHELRTPLANIKLYLNLIEHGKPEKQVQYLEVLKREELRLEHLIEDLLALSRMDLAKVDMQCESLDIGELAARLVADREALAVDKGLTLAYEPALDSLPPVLADAMMVSQVLTNLISNAMNYTLPGGRVTVRMAKQEAEGKTWVTVAVQDTGVGITIEEMEQLFERFYRGHAARQTGAAGTGLGLAICEEIVNRHKGRITVESTPAAGSTFTVWLPPV